MSKYYVFEINSLVNSFEIIEAGKVVSFNYCSQDDKKCFAELSEGDRFLGCYAAPVKKVKFEFEVKRVSDRNQIELVKLFEVNVGIDIFDKAILRTLEINGIVEISKDMYIQMRSAMIKGVEGEFDIDLTYLYELENKEFAIECMKILNENNALTNENVEILESKEKTSKILKNSYPILVELPLDCSEEEKKKILRDESGQSRYYPEVFRINKRNYLITNNWYYNGQNGRDTRTSFVEWIKSMLSKNKDDMAEVKYVVGRDVEIDMSIEQLGKILSDMYNASNSKTTAIHMFGIKYGPTIKKNGYSAVGIVAASGIGESYHVEVSKGVRIYESILENEYGITFYNGEEVRTSEEAVLVTRFPARVAREKKIHPLNCIIYGAPGTGKTYSTAEYAQAIIEGISLGEFQEKNKDRKVVMEKYNQLIAAKRIVFTTFHQSYGYEEFIQGLRPDTRSDKMLFKTVDGIFKQIADKAMGDADNNYVIIIDEINRANISKVFGELITLIEDDKRWGEINQTSATLQSGDCFAVPNNLYIVGTMNSADKSISLIDAALRRRFEFIEQKPDSSLVVDPTLKDVFEKINGALASQLDSADLLIGHSYFMNKTVDDLPKILNNSIIPLLYEYFYDNKKKVVSVLGEAVKSCGCAVEDDKLGRIFIERQK